MLIGSGADVNRATNVGKTPLHLSAEKGKFVKVFLFKIFHQTFRGIQFYLFLFWSGYQDNLARLLENGANVNAIDKDQNTPLHLAAAKGDSYFISKSLLLSEKEYFLSFVIIELLLYLGKNKYIVKQLIKAGASVNAKNEADKTPFDLADEHSNKFVNLTFNFINRI